MKSLTYLSLLLSSAVGTLVKVSYDGAKAVRISVGDDVVPLLEVITKLELPTWKGVAEGIPVANGFVDLVVPADKVAEFGQLTGEFSTEILHEDLGLSIDEESRNKLYISKRAESTDLAWLDSYHPYADHVRLIYDLAASYPNNSEVIVVGKGVQKAVVIHGTVHAREWISTKTTQYFADHILTSLETNNEIRMFVNRYDFHIFPVVNPDGFLYTQTDDRLWRKNHQAVAGSSCLGRDINRNWDYKWDLPGGASTDPYTLTYKGLAPHDTPENQALSAHINNLTSSTGIQLYLDIHSYGQYILSPYGYDCTAYPPNKAALVKTAQRAAAEFFSVYNTQYVAGPSCTTLYATTGSSVDYIHGVGKSNYTYTVELRDQGRYGFVLPARRILPTVLETWVGFRHMLKDI